MATDRQMAVIGEQLSEIQKIGVISDTHGRPLPAGVHRVFAGCARILHAGDIGEVSVFGGQSIIDELETIAPVTAVLGNSPADRRGEYFAGGISVTDSVNGFGIGGVLFFMAHNDKELNEWKHRVANPNNASSEKPQVWIHGHTHERINYKAGKCHTLCPGSISHPRDGNKPGVAIITIRDGEVLRIHFEDV